MIVDFIASKIHYVDHLLPVWWALDPKERGAFNVPPALYGWLRYQNVPISETNHRSADVVVAASWPDVRGSRRHSKKVLFEHGIGQTYHQTTLNPHYAGGLGRDSVDLFLAPNERVLQLNKEATPNSEHALVGTPKMDTWFLLNLDALGSTAVSFHWRCRVCEESYTGFDHFKSGVLELAKGDPSLMGHSHPTMWQEARDWYEKNGIRAVRLFAQVLFAADVYCCDNSSTLYEFAALDRPVVVLNPPHYRREVEHGLRFWEYADVGIQCGDPKDLVRAVDEAREDHPLVQERRHEIIDQLYPVRDGSSSRQAVEAIRSLSVL